MDTIVDKEGTVHYFLIEHGDYCNQQPMVVHVDGDNFTNSNALTSTPILLARSERVDTSLRRILKRGMLLSLLLLVCDIGARVHR